MQQVGYARLVDLAVKWYFGAVGVHEKSLGLRKYQLLKRCHGSRFPVDQGHPPPQSTSFHLS